MFTARHDLVIIDTPAAVVRLCWMCRDSRLPTIDVDALLSIITESVCFAPEADTEINSLVEQVISSDLLFNMAPEIYTPDSAAIVQKLTDQIKLAGLELVGSFRAKGMLENNYFNYQYVKKIYDNALVFRKHQR